MGNKQIRTGQLITPFGPGSLYTDRRGTPHAICGLDHWFKRSDDVNGLSPCDNRAEFERFEPRLAALLNVNRFAAPPDYRATRLGETPIINSFLNIPAVRFPRWYRNSKSGIMRRFNLNTRKIDRIVGGGRWLPVRFVAICAGGHLCEFPWKEWIGCTCSGDGTLVLTDRGGADLASIRVECRSCPEGSAGKRGRTLSNTTTKPDAGEQGTFARAGIRCPGDRPWLGEGANEEGCAHPLVGALINQTNLYFAKTVSAISLPDLQIRDDEVVEIRNELEKDPGTCGIARTLWNMPDKEGALDLVGNKLARRGLSYSPEKLELALGGLFSPERTVSVGTAEPRDPESNLLAFRREEFNIIRSEVNDPKNIPHLRVVPADIPKSLSRWLAKVNLVERLRETKVFCGFDRLDQRNDLSGMPRSALNQLFRFPPRQQQDYWLPAIEVFGEGIYLELNEESLTKWQAEQAAWFTERLDDTFVIRLAGEFKTLPPLRAPSRLWASRYLVVHTLAHVLTNQLVFECGYSTASLRERLYVSADAIAPMAGILIYTAAGDSEGTLGGLVRLGRPDRLEPMIYRAAGRASWCSADPVCSEHLGGQGSRLANLAACHACALLPETSCETINQGLDRAMLLGLPDARQHGFMSDLLEGVYWTEKQ